MATAKKAAKDQPRKAASKKSSVKKVVAKKTSPKKATLKKVATKKAAPKKTTLKEQAPKNASAKKAVVKKTASKKTVLKKVASKKIASKKTATKKPTGTLKKAATKAVKKAPLSDDTIDIEAFDKEFNANVPKPESKSTLAMSALGNTCPMFKQPRVIRDNPKMAGPVDKANYITELRVKLSTQQLTITWLNGTQNTVLCSPNPRLTPKVRDVVGYKCGPKHTNYSRDAMAWFTAFKSRGMMYGFHNSQRVGIGIVSHGCVRVLCDNAKMINQNSWSGVTKIVIVA